MHFKILYNVYCMFTSPRECGLCTHHISSLTDPGLVGCSRKGPHFLQKNPPAEISGYGPVESVFMCSCNYITVAPRLSDFRLSAPSIIWKDVQKILKQAK